MKHRHSAGLAGAVEIVKAVQIVPVVHFANVLLSLELESSPP